MLKKNFPAQASSPTCQRGHAPPEVERGVAGVHVAFIAFAAIAWVAVTAAIDWYFGRELARRESLTPRDLATVLILATFSAPTLLVCGACAAAGWQRLRSERSFEPEFDRAARPDRPALSQGAWGAAALNAWAASLAAALLLAFAFEFELTLPRWASLAIYLAAILAGGLATLRGAWRPAMPTSDRWLRLVRKTRWTPFFTRPQVTRDRRLLVIRERWGLRLLLAPAFLGAGMFGFLAFWRNPWGIFDHTPGAVLVLLQIILAGFVLISVYCLAEQRSVACSPSPPQLTVAYGWLLLPERLAFDSRELAASLSIDGPPGGVSGGRHKPVLLLTRGDQPSQALRLVSAEYYPNLREAFEPLTEMLGGPCSDQTIVEVELPNARRIHVSRAPRSGGACYRKLQFTAQHRARTPATWGARFVYFACIGVALFAGSGVIATLQHAHDWKHWLGAGCLALLTAAAGLAGAVGLCFEPSTLIDRRRGRLEIGAAAPWRRPRSVPLSNVAAIQLCTAPHEDSPLYQLNWVLASPEGARLPILDGHKRPLIERWARELGEFLDKPVLDHRKC